MLFRKKRTRFKKRRNRQGQTIVEYGSIIAFVAVVVSLVFSISNGTLRLSLSSSFSSITNQINNLSAAGASAS